MNGHAGRHNQVHSGDDGHPASEFDVTADEVTCQRFVELVTDYFEGALAPRTLGRVEEHLVLCDWCVTYVEQMQATIGSLRELKEPASPEPPESVLAALRARRAAGQ
jgi:predicted anti-sigma-YlaC factor YlaD